MLIEAEVVALELEVKEELRVGDWVGVVERVGVVEGEAQG